MPPYGLYQKQTYAPRLMKYCTLNVGVVVQHLGCAFIMKFAEKQDARSGHKPEGIPVHDQSKRF